MLADLNSLKQAKATIITKACKRLRDVRLFIGLGINKMVFCCVFFLANASIKLCKERIDNNELNTFKCGLIDKMFATDSNVIQGH